MMKWILVSVFEREIVARMFDSYADARLAMMMQLREEYAKDLDAYNNVENAILNPCGTIFANRTATMTGTLVLTSSPPIPIWTAVATATGKYSPQVKSGEHYDALQNPLCAWTL